MFNKKKILVETIISKNCTEKKKIDMSLQAWQCLKDVDLMKKKTNLIITGEKIYC